MDPKKKSAPVVRELDDHELDRVVGGVKKSPVSSHLDSTASAANKNLRIGFRPRTK